MVKNEITFVTENIHKYEEVSKFIANNVPNYQIKQSTIKLSELQADTLEEVANFKVKSVKKWVKPPYFIEDAGFFVDDILNGFPGVYSSYVMRTIGFDGILKLLDKNQGEGEGEGKKKKKGEIKAHFESVIAYMDKYYQVRIFKGINKGIISEQPLGNNGFGFDPIFISEDFPTKTFAQLSMKEKNSVSHRRRSLSLLFKFLKNE